MLFLQWSPLLRATSKNEGDTSRTITERLSFGKMLYIYIEAHTFDVLAHTFFTKTEHSNAASVSLRGTLTQTDKLKILRDLCQSLIYFDGGMFYNPVGPKHSRLEFALTRSKICGRISRNSSFIAPAIITQEDNGHLPWVWHISVNRHFIINVTFLFLESRFYPPCITRALIKMRRNRPLGVFCPNNPPQSFYSTGNYVVINVDTWDNYKKLFLNNVYFSQWIISVSFTYEILDNDLSFDPWIQKRLPREKDDYRGYMQFSLLTPVLHMPRELPSIHLTGLMYLNSKDSFFWNQIHISIKYFRIKAEFCTYFTFSHTLGQQLQ